MRKEVKSIRMIALFVFSLVCQVVLAQKNEKIIAVAHYDYAHFIDTTKSKDEGANIF